MKKGKVLILGGEGFLGRNLTDYLSSNFQCFSIDKSESIFPSKKRIFLKINPYKEKIANDFQTIIHLIDNEVKESNYEINEKKLVKNLSPNKDNHLILFSSAVIYANPNSDYGKRKIKLENFYKQYCKKNNFKLTIIRLFNTYGPYQLPNRQGSLIGNILVNLLNKKTTIIKDPDAKRDFIFSRDIGKAVNKIIEKKLYGNFDLASNHLTSIRGVLEKIKKISDMEIKINNCEEIEQIKSPVGNSVLLEKNELTALNEGIKISLDFYKNNLDLINKLEEKNV